MLNGLAIQADTGSGEAVSKGASTRWTTIAIAHRGKRLHRCVLAVPQAALMRTTTSFYIDGVYSCLNSVPWFSNRTMLLSFSFFPHVRKKEKETSRPSCIDWHVLLFVGQTTAMDALWASRTDARPDSCTAVPSLYLSA